MLLIETLFSIIQCFIGMTKSAREIISMQPTLYYIVRYFCCLKQLNWLFPSCYALRKFSKVSVPFLFYDFCLNWVFYMLWYFLVHLLGMCIFIYNICLLVDYEWWFQGCPMVLLEGHCPAAFSSWLGGSGVCWLEKANLLICYLSFLLLFLWD